jgi:hypothetical protein
MHLVWIGLHAPKIVPCQIVRDNHLNILILSYILLQTFIIHSLMVLLWLIIQELIAFRLTLSYVNHA